MAIFIFEGDCLLMEKLAGKSLFDSLQQIPRLCLLVVMLLLPLRFQTALLRLLKQNALQIVVLEIVNRLFLNVLTQEKMNIFAVMQELLA